MRRRFTRSRGAVMACCTRAGCHTGVGKRRWDPGSGPVATVAGERGRQVVPRFPWGRSAIVTGGTTPIRYSAMGKCGGDPGSRLVASITFRRSRNVIAGFR